MALDDRHPQYTDMHDDWELMKRSYKGERAIKDKDTDYLPATSGMEIDGMDTGKPGRKMYDAYKMRAKYPGLMRHAVETLIGALWTKPPVFNNIPAALEPMLKSATIDGESLEQLLRRIHEAQLVEGRVGLMLDVNVTDALRNKALPYIATYGALSIVNWDEGKRDEENAQRQLSLVVLDESEFERTTAMSWEFVEKYRVLTLGDPLDPQTSDKIGATFQVATAQRTKSVPGAEEFKEPNIRGTKLNQIPFVFINTKDNVPQPDDPPLKPLADLALTIYRGDADYRQNLYMQTQDTLVLIGAPSEDEPGSEGTRIGAGATIRITNPEGDAKFIGVSASGLEAQRAALEDDRKEADKLSGQLIDSVSRSKESGEALSTRIAAKTASLRQIAITSAAGLEKLLKIAAEWMNLPSEDIEVIPNLDFDNEQLSGTELTHLVSAKTMGAPLSRRSIHAIMSDKGMTEMTYEEELAEIESEEPLAGSTVDLAEQGLDIQREGLAPDEDEPDEDDDVEDVE